MNVYEWLLSESDQQTEAVIQNVIKHVGIKSLGHNNLILSFAYSRKVLVTKDEKSMRLWRAKDGTLLRVISVCPGDTVSFSPRGQKIVTGYINKKSQMKFWGPAGASAVGCGKTKIKAGKD